MILALTGHLRRAGNTILLVPDRLYTILAPLPGAACIQFFCPSADGRSYALQSSAIRI
jgi:hypothetical protein